MFKAAFLASAAPTFDFKETSLINLMKTNIIQMILTGLKKVNYLPQHLKYLIQSLHLKLELSKMIAQFSNGMEKREH